VGEEMLSFAVVADGHGGAAAAVHCRKHAVQYICEATQDASGPSLRRAGRVAFERLHAEVRASLGTAGSTLTVCVVNLKRAELTTINVGDSQALLMVKGGPTSSRPRLLSADHRLAECEREVLRCQQLGANIARAANPHTGLPGGPLRAWPGGVAVARTIGDADVGDLISAVPASCTVQLPAWGSWDCILCSDGVWDALPFSAVFRSCRRSGRAHPDKTAQLIVDDAVTKRHAFNNEGFKVPRDDTTCVILRLHDPLDNNTGGCLVQNCAELTATDEWTLGETEAHDEIYEGQLA